VVGADNGERLDAQGFGFAVPNDPVADHGDAAGKELSA